jgi:hypothetical protein
MHSAVTLATASSKWSHVSTSVVPRNDYARILSLMNPIVLTSQRAASGVTALWNSVICETISIVAAIVSKSAIPVSRNFGMETF